MKIRALLVLLLLTWTVPVTAAELVMVPSIGFGTATLDFSRSTGESDDTRFNMIEIGMTASYGDYYIKLSSELPLGEEYTYGPMLVRQIKREDFGATLGYYLTDDLSLFTGYSYGKTSVITTDGSVSAFPVLTQHRDHGPFIGANYTLYVGKTASIGINLAYAAMDGSLVIEDTNPVGTSSSNSGNTSGFSLATTWSDTYKDKLTYYLTYKRKQYTSDLGAVSVDKGFGIISFGFVFPI